MSWVKDSMIGEMINKLFIDYLLKDFSELYECMRCDTGRKFFSWCLSSCLYKGWTICGFQGAGKEPRVIDRFMM